MGIFDIFKRHKPFSQLADKKRTSLLLFLNYLAIEEARDNGTLLKLELVSDTIKDMLYYLIKPEYWNNEEHINKLFDFYLDSKIGSSKLFLEAIKNSESISSQKAAEMLSTLLEIDSRSDKHR